MTLKPQDQNAGCGCCNISFGLLPTDRNLAVWLKAQNQFPAHRQLLTQHLESSLLASECSDSFELPFAEDFEARPPFTGLEADRGSYLALFRRELPRDLQTRPNR